MFPPKLPKATVPMIDFLFRRSFLRVVNIAGFIESDEEHNPFLFTED